jgi:Ca-activated chloride channel family protein
MRILSRSISRCRSVLKAFAFIPVALLLTTMLASCSSAGSSPELTFRLLTGTENREEITPILERLADQENVKLEIDYQGSVDTMITLQQGAKNYDAVWPASSIWVALGDTQHIVQQSQSIMRSPVIFGVKRSVAERLGWIGRDVTVEDILAAAESGQLRYMMTSATQSNSGAMAYLGYLSAFAGHPQVLTSDMLHDPAVLAQTKSILRTVNRSAGASGFLKDLFLRQYDNYDGMVNNESAIISANQRLVAEGREPLYAIYPVDGLAIADWPLGFVDQGPAEKAEFFTKFQTYLLSDDVQRELLGLGRRTGPGIHPLDADPEVFNPEWGIDLERVIQPITTPSKEVINEALVLYQTELRKPSFTVYCLDFSGSMKGDGEKDLEEAMGILLDPEQASQYLLQPSPGDITVVIPFEGEVLNQWMTEGSDPSSLREILTQVVEQSTGGTTNIYAPVIAGLDAMEGVSLDEYSPAIILMTDGESNHGKFSDLEKRLEQESDGAVPVYAVMFGDANEDQLDDIADATWGDVFDGRKDLIGALRKARGYN